MLDAAAQLDALWKAPVGLALFDEELRYVKVNPALAEMNGVPAEAHAGRTVAEVLPVHGAEMLEHLRRVRDTGVAEELVVAAATPREPGVLRHWRLCYFPVRQEGRITGVGATVVDVTTERRAQAQLERSEEQRRLALRAAELGTWDFDLRTSELFWDERFGAIYGVGSGGMPFPELVRSRFHPDDRARVVATVSRALDPAGAGPEGIMDLEHRIVWPDGGVRWVQVKGEAFFEGTGAARRATRFVGTAADITAREEAREALRAALADAELERKKLSEVLEALRASEERFRSIFEQAAIGIGVVSFTDGRWVAVNDTFCAMLGYTREYLLRTPWPEITHPDDIDLDLIPFRRMAVGDVDSYTVEKRFIHEHGHPVWARLTLSLARDADGRPAYEIAIIEDITGSKRDEEALRESEERFKAFAEAIPHRAFIADAAGNITYTNGRFLEYFGFRPEEAEVWGRPPVHPEEKRRIYDGWAAGVRRGAPFELEYRARRRDGQYRWHLTNAAPVRDRAGRISMWVGTSIDVHDQRTAALELQRANDRLVEADRRKNEFLAMLSHELRNPLAPVRNSLYILERAAPGGQQAERALSVIDRQVGHMTRLVDDLLDVTRISRGKIRLQRDRLEVGELVRRTAEDHRAVFERTGVELAVRVADTPLFLDGDATRLSQVVGNILGNAAKFTPPGGHVTLAVEQRDGAAEIRIRDDGAGIAPELAGKLFDPFVQADQTLDRTRGGLGLGLALVKGLVEMHGGSVAVASEGPGKGAEFTVRLPLAEAARDEEPLAVDAAAPYGLARRVLIIEDNADAAESLKEALELGEHVVDIAATGPDGIGKARALKPELILCDIGLPGMDGFEVAKTLRADPELRDTYLVALSGYAAPEDVERARAAGFDRHVPKPVAVAALEHVLGSLPQAGG